MDFTLCPEGGPPRLVRFQAIPEYGVVAKLDHSTNVLVIDPDRYDQLSEDEQNSVLRTRANSVHVDVETQNAIVGEAA